MRIETSKLEHCAMCAFLLNSVVECSPKIYFILLYFLLFCVILFFYLFYLSGLEGWRETQNLEHFHLVLLAALQASKHKHQKDCRNHCIRQDTEADCSSLQRVRWIHLCV